MSDNIQEKKNAIKKALNELDTGKAITAAIVVALIGFISKILIRIYNIEYWKTYFNIFNIPKQYYLYVESSINLADIALAIALTGLYIVCLFKKKRDYIVIKGKKIKRKKTYKNPLTELMKWDFVLFLLAVFTRGLLPPICIFMYLSFFITIIIKICDAGSIIENKVSILGAISAIITIFIISLSVVYWIGCITAYIKTDYYMINTMDTNDKGYIYILNLEDSYMCMPAEINAEKEEITIYQNKYKIIPKEESVTFDKLDIYTCKVNSEILGIRRGYGLGLFGSKIIKCIGLIALSIIFGTIIILLELRLIK